MYQVITARGAERLQCIPLNNVGEAVGAKCSSDDRQRAAERTDRDKPEIA